jgi:hypothetical protein
MLVAVMGVFGLAQGVRHACEPDHIAAVATVVAEQRTARASMFYAAAWGAGHALMLIAFGGVLFALKVSLAPAVADAFELCVAAMLVALGVRGIVSAVRKRQPSSGNAHAHPHKWSLAKRPLAIGVVHGLAGSGGLTAVVAGSATSIGSGLFFMSLYAIGAMLGMAALAGVAGVPLARAARSTRLMPFVLGVSGVLSLAMGVVWAWPIVSTHAGLFG